MFLLVTYDHMEENETFIWKVYNYSGNTVIVVHFVLLNKCTNTSTLLILFSKKKTKTSLFFRSLINLYLQ